MSTGMKKPPVAPKPKLVPLHKPSPPPIAPKPEILLPSPSPTAHKRGKPAVAPKPCLLKAPQKPVQARQDHCKNQHPPVSKNGGPALLSSNLSHYIIPPCNKVCHLANNKSNDSKEISREATLTTEVGVFKEGDSPKEHLFSNDTWEHTARSEHVQEQVPTDSTQMSTEAQDETNSPSVEKDQTSTQVLTSDHIPRHCPTEPLQERSSEVKETGNVFSSCTSDSVGVPAPPSKPLPVPHPRRPRRALLRQNVVEIAPSDTQADIPTETPENAQSDGLQETPKNTTCHSHTSTLQNACCPKEDIENTDTDSSTKSDPLHKVDSFYNAQTEDMPSDLDSTHYSVPTNGATLASMDTAVEDGSQPPAPPPRQKSLPQMVDSLCKASTSVDNLLLHCQSDLQEVTSNDEDAESDDEDDGAYGDFARYPITRSLPKQIKLSCGSQVIAITKPYIDGDEKSPKVMPKKPQRNSLPASVALRKQGTPPPLPNSNPPVFGELPAPPQEKPSWRVALPSIPLFSRNQPTRSNSQPQAGVVGSVFVKQRAKSFSSADLQRVDNGSEASEQLARSDQTRRSLRKLLELRVCARLLPKLLRSGQSLDCTRTDSEYEEHKAVPANQVTSGDDEEAQGDSEADCGVEYENVPLYEEIPEYMNLPWVYSNQDADTDVYEVQEPCEANRCSVSADLSEDGLSSNEEDGDSSDSSKEDMRHSKDKEEVERAKRNKVVHIAMEIMSSEKVFVDVLKLLHIDFRDAVAKATRASGKPLVEEKVLNQILYYLPQLYELNKDLLKELEERVAHWSDHQRLADIFVQKGPYLKMYSTYIREFDRNVALLDEQCRKNPPFSSVVRQFETSPRCASLALKHYLLKPVQRIPQYQLLLTDYLKNLPEDSSDYKDTQTALSVVKEVANHANDIMKQGDNFQKLMQVQYSLNGHHEIVQPGRVFLKEGTLMKLSRKVMQPRMFFLFNDILLYTTPVQSGQYKVNSMLSLAGMKVSKPSQEAYQNELNIESVERSFILSANSATERDEWLEAIATAIDDYTRKKISFFSSRSQELEGISDDGLPLGSKAPIWIPDLRTTMCMICTCEFTLTWRRHHCRACGKVVCQACSSNKFYLEYLKNQLARVCDHCYIKLQHKGDQSNVTFSPSGRGSTFAFSRKQKKIPSALKEVSANTENSSMSGYLHRSKGHKKPWKRLWFVIKNKVLYTYAASEDVAALESQPLLGFFLREEKTGPAQKLQFKLYHKNTLYYIFRAEDIPTAQRWIEAFQEAMIL
ncbi:FYVE, RhoGEF and PH domain-containing protein 6 isoform X2 [Danio rerio]|uniref:FYVE, RhoGEF and PH domain-containing 6 n=3 Tax=Danio rerio TaxID=7955 RepID=A0A286Y8J4_DANRE|nr:FYVE, RhoGEF and PH domain-containing protein 6 isoform X2 [Danio rerio]|eukprot:XP_005164880.1 FYVE, RhoGEF and PH domain-containing protein 6 isoform X2 [Danio rerio]